MLVVTEMDKERVVQVRLYMKRLITSYLL